MKKYLVLILPLLLFLSCSKNDTDLLTHDIRISHKGKDYEIKNQENLNHFVENVIDKKELIVTSASYKTLQDEMNQDFEAIVATYNLHDKMEDEIIIVLEENNTRNTSAQFSFSVGCTMKCNEGNYCSACGMTVEEACKRVICSCTKQVRPGSGCGVEIATY